MTAAMQMMLGGTPQVVTGTAVVADTKAGANAIGNIYVQSSGQLSYAGSGSSGPPQWWSGALFSAPTVYCTNTVNSGTPPTTNPGTLVPTVGGGTPLWQWTEAAVGTLTANCTLRLYWDAAGTQLAGSITYTVSVQRTS